MEEAAPDRMTITAIAAQLTDLISRLEHADDQDRIAARQLEREVAVIAADIVRLADSPERRVLMGVARDLTANLWHVRRGEEPVAAAAELRAQLAGLVARPD